MNEDLILVKQLEFLRTQHRDIDLKVNENALDEFTRKRLQKEKLAIRDQIMRLEHMVYPDIIA
jgi:hypothetical protein